MTPYRDPPKPDCKTSIRWREDGDDPPAVECRWECTCGDIGPWLMGYNPSKAKAGALKHRGLA